MLTPLPGRKRKKKTVWYAARDQQARRRAQAGREVVTGVLPAVMVATSTVSHSLSMRRAVVSKERREPIMLMIMTQTECCYCCENVFHALIG